MTLAQQITDYYFSHITELSEANQFHFASRLSAWNHDSRAQRILEDVKPSIIEPTLSHKSFVKFARNLIDSPPAAKINAAEEREKYFQKYPQLRGLDFVLFRLRHIQTIYQQPTDDYLYEVMSQSQLRQLADTLLQDKAAVRTLSTYAVNYFYLLDIVQAIKVVSPDYFIDIAKAYDLKNPVHIQLFIYLFTHCIIGASNFYTQSVPNAEIPVYQQMLNQLEQVIQANYDVINLDNKFEFLVCCRICNYKSSLFDRINAEAVQSVSETGTYLVDRHNDNSQSNKTSLQDSEHRNVLYIMAQSSYPHASS